MSKIDTKGIRFYAEVTGSDQWTARSMTRKKLRALAEAGVKINCVAVLLGDEHRNHDGSQEALVSTFAHADSDVSLGGVGRDYLARHCRHIDAKTALALHPMLAQRLEREVR